MTLAELDLYVQFLAQRAAWMRGLPLKATLKHLAVAKRERERKAQPED